MRRIAALFNKMYTTTQALLDPSSSRPLLAFFSLLISHLQTHSPHNTRNNRIRLLALCDFINAFNAVVNLTLHTGVSEHGTNEGGVLGGLGGGADGAEFFDLLHEEVYVSRVRGGKGVCVRDFVLVTRCMHVRVVCTRTWYRERVSCVTQSLIYLPSSAQRYSGEVLRLGPNNIQSLSPYRAGGAEDGEILLEGGAL